MPMTVLHIAHSYEKTETIKPRRLLQNLWSSDFVIKHCTLFYVSHYEHALIDFEQAALVLCVALVVGTCKQLCYSV